MPSVVKSVPRKLFYQLKLEVYKVMSKSQQTKGQQSTVFGGRHGSHNDICIAEFIIGSSVIIIVLIVIAEVIRILDDLALPRLSSLASLPSTRPSFSAVTPSLRSSSWKAPTMPRPSSLTTLSSSIITY